MPLVYLFRKLIYAQVLLGIAAFCMAEPGGNPGMLLIAGALAVLSWYIVEGPNGRPLPQWAILTGAAAAIFWLLRELLTTPVFTYDQRALVTAVGHFTMWLQILQLYGPKTNRDYALILVLGLMQMVGASILSVSVVFGILLAAYCALGLLTALLFQFKVTGDRIQAANQAAAPESLRVERPALVGGRRQRTHFRLLAAAVGLLSTLVAVLLFVFLPRTSRYTQDEASAILQQVGFTPTIHLDAPPPAATNHEPVLTLSLQFLGSPLVVPEALEDLRRLRGAALDTYNPLRREWVRGPGLVNRDLQLDVPDSGLTLAEVPARAALPGAGLALAPIPPAPQVVEVYITLRNPHQRTLFAPQPVTALYSRAIDSASFNPLDQQLSAVSTSPGALAYRLERPLVVGRSLFDAYRRLGRPASRSFPRALFRPDPFRDYARGWSVQTERVRALAFDIIRARGLDRDPAALADPRDRRIAAALTDYLRENYAYSLANPPRSRRDEPTIQFLFERREGHCELFASGLAALARAIGLRARVVTGYLASDYNQIGGYYVVRQSDAHAWTEIDCGEDGWVTFDATPPGDVAAEHRGSGWAFLRPLRQLYEHVEFSWLGAVVAYDKETRQALVAALRRWFVDAWSDPDTALGQLASAVARCHAAGLTDPIILLVLALAVCALVLGTRILTRHHLTRRQRLSALRLTALPPDEQRRLRRALRFYLDMLDMLERHGHRRPPALSPLAFAHSLAAQSPQRFAPVVALTQHFYEVRFGHHPCDEPRRQLIRTHLRELELQLAGT